MTAARPPDRTAPSPRRISLPVALVAIAFLAGVALLVTRALPDGGAARDPRARAAGHEEALDPYRSDRAWSRPSARSHGFGLPRAQGRSDRGGFEAEPSAAYDPQLAAMQSSFGLEADAGVPLPFYPVERPARIVDSAGLASVARDCRVRVLPVSGSRFNCLVRVMCGGQVLYPNPDQTAGYVPCELEQGSPTSAIDDGHTASDGDPIVSLDLRAGTVVVSDHGDGVAPFQAVLQIDG